MRLQAVVVDHPEVDRPEVDQSAMDGAVTEQKPAVNPRLDPRVDQRQTERRGLNYPASVRVIGTPDRVLQGEIRNLSEGGTQIWIGEPLLPFTLVRVEYGDNLLLGEVVYCQQDRTGWVAGLRVEHGLFGLTDLAAAMERF